MTPTRYVKYVKYPVFHPPDCSFLRAHVPPIRIPGTSCTESPCVGKMPDRILHVLRVPEGEPGGLVENREFD
jgi:hypothetical protein